MYNFILTIRSFKKAIIPFFCCLNTLVFAQDLNTSTLEKSAFTHHPKGDFFLNWGYNISWYKDSDIHFSGLGHDFTLRDVKAKDRPTKFNLDYFHPTKITIPQFNFRFGYFITDRLSVSIGWDHMKYVAVDFQTVTMRGYIDPSRATDPLIKTNMEHINEKYAPLGIYEDTQVQMTPSDFIDFEHTDGLNYATLDLERWTILWEHSKYKNLGISLVSGIGAGMIIPRTDAHLFGSGRNHYWNVAGWGISAKIGLQINLTKRIYMESNFKYGYMKMLNIRSTDHYDQDKAQQKIVFYENNWLIGFRF